MQVKVQVVTITDEGQEITQDIACVERQDLTPVTLGLSLPTEAVLQALQEWWASGSGSDLPSNALLHVARHAAAKAASHGVSHRLRGLSSRVPLYPCRVDSKRNVQSPRHAAPRTDHPELLFLKPMAA